MLNYPIRIKRLLFDFDGDECWRGTRLRRMTNEGKVSARAHGKDKETDPSSVFILSEM